MPPDISFTPDNDLYKNRDTLFEDYTPDTIVGRDTELEQYHEALQPVINGERPSNIFLYGKTGVGKTAATKFLLDRLQRDADQYDVDLTVIYLNCEDLSKSYQIAVKLVNELRDPSDQISETGHPGYKVYEYLWDELDAVGGTILVVLDEVDNIGDDDSILYQIPRARSNEHITNAKVGIIGISNDLSFRDNLSAKVRSSLCEKAISFPPYDAPELQDVLQQRADTAFHDDALADDVLPLCAAYGAQDAGDARKALDLLREAGDIARAADADHVHDHHVEKARDKLEREEVMDGIADLAEHQQLTLYALATFEGDDETPVSSSTVYDRYQSLCHYIGSDPRSARRVRDFLKELADLSITARTPQNEGLSGGKYHDHDLKHDLETVVVAMADLVDYVGVHEGIEDVVRSSDEIVLSSDIDATLSPD
ncbi:orc1/cdc6 family replication initiation protein [Halorussus caseinilyticus]|uniref:ORC1-type DNA replication protein n=1 Tax=Halorussus caseinilyticus TaxID=3034025 RepID=A0ABD5WFJ2_9EURY|nr:orc1/cdc6 family replication initiation protein [Halorussus sp. DT72]